MGSELPDGSGSSCARGRKRIAAAVSDSKGHASGNFSSRLPPPWPVSTESERSVIRFPYHAVARVLVPTDQRADVPELASVAVQFRSELVVPRQLETIQACMMSLRGGIHFQRLASNCREGARWRATGRRPT